MLTPIPHAANIDLSSGWSKIWGLVPSQITTFMTVAGVAIIVVAIFVFLWRKRKNQGQGGAKELLWPIVLGAALAGPGVLIPMILKIISMIINFAVAFAHSMGW